MVTPAITTVMPMIEPPLARIENTHFSMGCDPEVFAVSGKEVIPAYKFLPDKKNAITFRDHEYQLGKSSIFWDGVQAEMTTPPDQCVARLVDAVHYGLRRIKKAAVKFAPDARLTISNIVPFSEYERMNAAKEHVELGCSPSKNVYGDFGRFVQNGRKLPIRFAGGHITCGVRTAIERREEVVRALDAILGVWAVGAAASIDEPERRQFYGLAGEYRAPTFGVEYRTLSNFWLCHPGIMSLVFEIARVVVNAVNSDLHLAWQATERETCDTINTCNVGQARAILARNYRLFNHLMDHTNISSYSAQKRAIEVGLQGVESVVKDYRDIEGNWHLGGYWKYHAEIRSAQFATLVDPEAAAT